MANIFQTICYACGTKIYGMHNRYGGVFYKDSVKGEFHKKTCPSGVFSDAVQSGSVDIRHLHNINPDQLNIFPETRVCRLCWNTNGWVKPSGRLDKTKNESHEAKYGYGHEEWLFDLDKIIEGYHYGFLEPVNKFREKYIGKTFDLILYTIKGDTKQRYVVGELKNVEVINYVKAADINKIYKKNGWLELMKVDLREFQLDEKSIDKWIKDNALFNVRFKPEEIKGIFDKLQPVETYSITGTDRYNLTKITKDTLRNIQTKPIEFDYNTGSSDDKELSTHAKMRYSQHEVELPLKHNIISSAFLKYMKKIEGKKVKRECRTVGNGRVDLVEDTGNGYIFYEIKTYNHLTTSMRMAIGQLLEYGCYPDKRYAKKFYLVSDAIPESDFIKYVNHLNSIINIPFGYIQFDPDQKKIIKKIN